MNKHGGIILIDARFDIRDIEAIADIISGKEQ